jgi:hypothetical protein
MWAAWFFGTKYVLKNLLPNLPEGVFRLVPGGGVEPPRPEGRRILSPLRLPVPPSRRGWEVVEVKA